MWKSKAWLSTFLHSDCRHFKFRENMCVWDTKVIIIFVFSKLEERTRHDLADTFSRAVPL